jgi:ABC-type glycerol-3-phosphate transport system substrate-binding protein
MNFTKNIALGMAMGLSCATAVAAGEITIATVNNGHMIEMQKLSGEFEKSHPGITTKWVVLDEGTLRSRVTTDISTKGGQFDVMTIGMYEAPIWGKRNWLEELSFSDGYDVEDILPAMREGLSYDGRRRHDRQGKRRLRHLPARQAGLGRQHGVPVDHGKLFRCSMVRNGLEADAGQPRVAQCRVLLC